MPQQPRKDINAQEARIKLAIQAIEKREIESVQEAALAYDVPRTTLIDRRVKRSFRRDCQPNCKNLTPTEE